MEGKDDTLVISPAFRALAYLIQGVYLLFLFSPFVMGILPPTSNTVLGPLVLLSLATIAAGMLLVSGALLGQTAFRRDRMRRLIGVHYILNYILAPILLVLLNPFIVLLTVVPPLGFLLSNKLLAGEALRPKTM